MWKIVSLFFVAISLLDAQTQLNISQRQLRATGLTVATLPGSPTTGEIQIITDGTAANDCTVGGGSSLAICRYSGAAWASVGGGTVAHSLLGTSHSDTTTQTVTRGSLIYANSTPAWDELVVGSNLEVLASDGTDAAWTSLTEAHISDLGTYLTTVDISDDTNLAVTAPITLTGDTVAFDNDDLALTGTATITDAAAAAFVATSTPGITATLQMGSFSTEAKIGTTTNHDLSFITNNTAGALLDNAQNFIGVTSIGFAAAKWYPPSASEPQNCTTSNDGSMYFDTSDQKMCVCVNDGTDDEWVSTDDYSHATGHCSI